jgi:Na+/H+ antiporter NhaD/arsenite permease-like protein
LKEEYMDSSLLLMIIAVSLAAFLQIDWLVVALVGVLGILLIVESYPDKSHAPKGMHAVRRVPEAPAQVVQQAPMIVRESPSGLNNLMSVLGQVAQTAMYSLAMSNMPRTHAGMHSPTEYAMIATSMRHHSTLSPDIRHNLAQLGASQEQVEAAMEASKHMDWYGK